MILGGRNGGSDERGATSDRHGAQDRVGLVRRFAVEVHPREVFGQDAAAQYAHGEMRRIRQSIGPFTRLWHPRLEAVAAVGTGPDAADAFESRGPEFEHAIGNPDTRTIDQTPRHYDWRRLESSAHRLVTVPQAEVQKRADRLERCERGHVSPPLEWHRDRE